MKVRCYEMEKIKIDTEFITLGKFVKFLNLCESGGACKMFIQENIIFINKHQEDRRGKKLYNGDKIVIKGVGEYIISNVN